MHIQNQKDFWAGILFFVTGAAFAIGALHYSAGTSAKPGPGFFPLGLGMLVAILGAAVMLSSIGRQEVQTNLGLGAIAWRPLIAIVAALVLFGFCMPRLGWC